MYLRSMEGPVGVRSHEGWWMWDGRRSDSVAAACWLILVPCVLALVTLALARYGHLTATGVLVVVVVAYGVWAFIGGALVRPRGRWREIFLVACGLVAFVGLVDVIAFAVVSAVGPRTAGDDDGVAVGLVMLVFVVFPPTLLLVALGRLVRRGVARLGEP